MRGGSSRAGLGREFYQQGRPSLSIILYISPSKSYRLTSHNNKHEDSNFEER